MSADALPNQLLHVPAAVFNELGITTVWNSSRDVKLLCAQRFVRMFAYGSSTLILASFLAALDISATRIGTFMTLTLAGDGAISFLLSLRADSMGRKAVLTVGSLLMIASGVAFGLFGDYFVLLAAAVFGVISPTGNETGPFRAVEESTLADVTSPELLCDIMVWYSLLGNMGAAAGMIVAGWVINFLQSAKGWDFVSSCRILFFAYAAIGVLKLVLTLCLSGEVEAGKKKKKMAAPSSNVEQQQPEPASETQPLLAGSANGDLRTVVENVRQGLFALLDRDIIILLIKLSVLFGLDAFASGTASPSWMTYFFKHKFSLSDGELGTIFSTTTIVAAGSMLVATSLAKRAGNINTMVYSHLLSSIWLILLPIPSNLPMALTFLTLRSCSQNMDVGPRGTFIAAILPAEKRTAVMGALNVIKTYSQSLGPSLTGILASRGLLGLAFIMAGILKIGYDFGVLAIFSGVS